MEQLKLKKRGKNEKGYNPDNNNIHTNYNNHFKDNNLTAILKPVFAGLVNAC